MKRALTRIVQWGQDLLSEVVCPGSLVVDLTVGAGQDTEFLYDLVGRNGQVIGVDIQSQALLEAQKRIEVSGGNVRLQLTDIQPPVSAAGVDLILCSHADISTLIPASVQGIIANLGYLPGGDPHLVTKPESTVQALRQSCSLLTVGGRLVVVVYPGHPGGTEEGQAVSAFFKELSDLDFQVIQLQVCNRPQAPFLFVAERLKGG